MKVQDSVKADMKFYILLQVAALFFLSNFYLKHGIGSMYVMFDFICKGYLELSGTRVERELQNEKYLPTVRFEPWTFGSQITLCVFMCNDKDVSSKWLGKWNNMILCTMF